ncbi:cytochrome P450 [Eremomyces bilateralis CBS 781.70]|uniref:Cytochrome P450 n=1 Tax=Eremomyces bilateralis CBS 781.70 TaxID=1392243 RepID=A0A6G1GH94_9PEZI|nr:cytochrome P450 [Eremomyces bilateralis CBS 781.70]KAF1817362.1 cytochrome P450 [Eremomyces bilateralis CBS 781.70]
MAIHSELLVLASEHPAKAIVSLLLAAVTLSLLVIKKIFQPIGKRSSKARLPPGPPGVFLLGSLLDFKNNRYDPEHKYLKSLTQYGEMTTIHLGSKTWILLNSPRVVSEIIAKRGTLTNGRSPMPIASGIVSRSRRSLLLPPSSWTEPRRVMHHLLSGAALTQYGAWQELESAQMMAEYLRQPGRWFRHHYRYANSVVHRIALGERLMKSGKELEDLQDVVTKFVGSIGMSLVDWFPDLDHLPRFLQVWRPYWERLDRWNYDIYRSWWLPVKEQIVNGTAPPSFVRDVLLAESTKYTGNDQDAMYVAMQLIEAGSDTTREALNVFVMASLCHPDAFRQARLEVDRVCGSNAERLPGLADMDALPYICAMIKEVLRWRPIFPLTPDHTATADFDFEGYHFPAGVGFVINGIPVCNACEDPDEFRPERWLDGHEMDAAHGLWQFGGGRRICVGYRLAQRGLFINMARLVYCFDYAPDGDINPIILNHHRIDEPFPVKVTVRSPKHEKLVLDEAKRLDVLQFAE